MHSPAGGRGRGDLKKTDNGVQKHIVSFFRLAALEAVWQNIKCILQVLFLA